MPLAAEEHVLDDVEVVGQGQVLVDGLDPERGRVLRDADVDRPALPEDLALVGLVDPGDASWSGTDLPAPLSPHSAVTWPAGRSRSTSYSAWTAPKCLPMPRSLSSGSSAAAELAGSRADRAHGHGMSTPDFTVGGDPGCRLGG